VSLALPKPLTEMLEKEGKPCWECGGAKPPGQGRKLCDNCRGPDLARERQKETADRTRRDRHYWNRYRIRLADYERMLEEQGGVCAICEGGCAPLAHFDVDHNATTGKVRGLLCRRCNLIVGLAELGILQAAIEYVRRWK